MLFFFAFVGWSSPYAMTLSTSFHASWATNDAIANFILKFTALTCVFHITCATWKLLLATGPRTIINLVIFQAALTSLLATYFASPNIATLVPEIVMKIVIAATPGVESFSNIKKVLPFTTNATDTAAA